MGRADVLFRFLQLMGKNRPKDVDEYLKQLDPADDRPLVDQLIALIIAGDAHAYDKYNQARREIIQTSENEEQRPIQGSLPELLDKWMKFEHKLRAVALLKQVSYKGVLSAPFLRKLEIFSDADLKIVESVRRLRHKILHGGTAPQSQVAKAEKEITQLLNRLEGQYPLGRRRKRGSSKVRVASVLSDS